jgi:hypothetical protein
MKVDAEHFAVRFWLPVLVIGVTVAFHFIALSVLGGARDSVNPECVVLPLDGLVLAVTAFGAERGLKRAIPSRRSATLSDTALAITDERRSPPEVRRVEWDKTVNVQAWHFAVRRKTRIPKGWYCMAIHLLQDETEVILYTFMPPDRAERLPGYKNFVRLRPRKETESSSDLGAVAQQRRLLKLEDARWADGAEIGHEDFQAVLSQIERRVPGWL